MGLSRFMLYRKLIESINFASADSETYGEHLIEAISYDEALTDEEASELIITMQNNYRSFRNER